jgi:hypothetical protein
MHTGGKPHTTSKDFETFGHKKAIIKHEKRGPPLIFSQPLLSPPKEFENDCIYVLNNF